MIRIRLSDLPRYGHIDIVMIWHTTNCFNSAMRENKRITKLSRVQGWRPVGGKIEVVTVACGMFSLLSRENKIVFATWVHRCYIYCIL